MAYGGSNPNNYGHYPEFTSQFQSFEFFNTQQPQQNQQQGPRGRPPWAQEWDQYYPPQNDSWAPGNQQQQQNSRVQRSNQPRQHQRQHNPRQNNSNGPRQNGGQQRQPRQQKQRQPQDERRPLMEDIQNEPPQNAVAEVVEPLNQSAGASSLNSSDVSKKRARNKPQGGSSYGAPKPGARWSRDGNRRPNREDGDRGYRDDGDRRFREERERRNRDDGDRRPREDNRNYPAESGSSRRPNSNYNNSENYDQNAYFCPPKREIKPINTGARSKNIDPQFKSQREFLMYNMNLEKHECMVCMEVLRKNNPIWSCGNCYNIFHIWCIQQWYDSASEGNWRCPGCQHQYVERPDKSCFCGKTLQQAKDMKLKSYSSKHCCEEVCFKKRPKVGSLDCDHPCGELCHPGPCPACEGMSLRKCPCGQTTTRVKCSVDSDLLCDKTCGRLLSCGRHGCERQCHVGSCDECASMTDLACMCGRKNETVPCKEAPRGSLDNYSCKMPCEKPLACGHHKCQDLCHFGKCKPCPLLPEVNTHCLCGKVAQHALLLSPRKSCLDPVPQCPNKCNQLLICDHNCPEKCHSGDCPPCKLQSQTYCACHSTKKKVPCAVLAFDPVRCNKKCSKWLTCLKHKCHDICCCRDSHECFQACNKYLNCGRHKCEQLCHSDRCAPCLLASFDELRCECGAEVMYPPIPCGSKRPPCRKPCPREHPCGHNGHNCHSEEECPPCTVPVKKWCMGNHKEVYPVLCNQEFVSCHLLCGKPLECGSHNCVKKCHAGACLQERCTQSCSKQRADCGHSCNVPCHGAGPCPDTKCMFELKVTCECKTRSETRPCYLQLEAYKKKVRMEALVENMSELMQGQKVPLPTAVPLAHWTTVVGLECGPECSVKQRIDRAFVALQIVNPDLGQKLKLDYPVALQNWVAQDKEFVKEVHNTLADLVYRTQEGHQRFRVHSFGVMNQIKRKFVHEYAAYFGLTSQSIDKKHSRSVDVTAEKNNCWLPSISLHELVGKKLTHSSSKSSLGELKQMAPPKVERPPAAPLASSSSTVLSYTQALAAKKQ